MFDNVLRDIGSFFSQFNPLAKVEPWQQAIRVRLGKWVARKGPGPHLRIPFMDDFYVQTVRTRACTAPTQTISTRDGHTMVLGAAVMYSISDIELLYRTMHDASDTILQFVASELASLVTSADKKDISVHELGDRATELLQGRLNDYGIAIEKVTVTDFAFVRTYRLVNDHRHVSGSWLSTSTPMPINGQGGLY